MSNNHNLPTKSTKLSDLQLSHTKSPSQDISEYLRSCKSKYKHFSKQESLEWLSKGRYGKNPLDFEPYKCKYCHNWHIGHTKEYYQQVKKSLPEDQRKRYLNHIRRLQESNRVLTEMLAEERNLRRQSYAWYRKRLKSKFMWIVDVFTMYWKDMEGE